ncbi:MAG: hypothetical protein OXC54_03560 [Rhodospirillaceae bacterium]|nr:hypothetical protein [Rhodospirillaceae bacterium]
MTPLKERPARKAWGAGNLKVPCHLFFGVAALTVHQMMRHPASSSTDDDDPGCLPGTGPINDTHLAPGCVPCATGGHADWDAADLIGDGGLVRAGLRGQRVDADLWDRVLGTDPVGQRKVDVPARGTAKLTLRCTPVDLLPPEGPEGRSTSPHDRRLRP